MAEQIEMLYQRDVYGKTLVELGKAHKDIVVLDADLSSSTRTALFAKNFPERFFNFGVAEQNMMATSAGLASCGKTVFASTFAIFASGRAWDQVRNTICYSNSNVKIVATHAGITVGPDGATHQALEDITLMRAITNMNVIVPCDGPETAEAIKAAYGTKGPFYIRLGRPKVPTLANKKPFHFGKAYNLTEGNDITIIACGIMVNEALLAAKALCEKCIGVRVINMHTIKPLDQEIIIKAAQETKGIVVCEEHSVIGGLASAVDEVVAENHPTTVICVGVKHRFGQSGESLELMQEYNLTAKDIEKAALRIVKK
ncbi:MAG: transketolase family protein [Candidatus Omnitrophica bacterium]|nr:transketolase family protein [Candidatus Omnitrophota bacterium]MDD5236694.1 transketolase family protein [Candidatus Omnitrophota bacterium]MDD5610089.1 transketolase family protein [Candidatus Omnitrophota bacterium]